MQRVHPAGFNILVWQSEIENANVLQYPLVIGRLRQRYDSQLDLNKQNVSQLLLRLHAPNLTKYLKHTCDVDLLYFLAICSTSWFELRCWRASGHEAWITTWRSLQNAVNGFWLIAAEHWIWFFTGLICSPTPPVQFARYWNSIGQCSSPNPIRPNVPWLDKCPSSRCHYWKIREMLNTVWIEWLH